MSIADELITRGWTQGTLSDPGTGGVCLAGAAAFAAMEHAEETTLRYVQLCDALHDVRGDFVTWNDAPGRTFDEVLRVAKQADELLDAQ